MQVFLREIRYFYRDKANLFFTFLFPLVLIFLLGNMLQNIEVSEYKIGQIRAGYYVDEELTNTSSLKTFLEETDKGENISFQQFSSEEEALSRMKRGELCAVVLLHQTSAEIMCGENLTQARAVKSMVDGYLTIAGTYKAILTENPVSAAELQENTQELVEKKSISARTMLDFYSVTLLVMMVFLGGVATAGGSICDDRRNHTLSRMDCSPAGKTWIFIQIIFGNLPYAVIQMSVIMLGSVVLFGARYCKDLRGNLMLFLMLFMVFMATIAFSAILGLIFKKGNPQIIAMGICWVMFFLSGSFVKNVYIEGLSDYLPTTMIQNAAFDLTIFDRYTRAGWVTVISTLCFLAFLILGTILFHRREQA